MRSANIGRGNDSFAAVARQQSSIREQPVHCEQHDEKGF